MELILTLGSTLLNLLFKGFGGSLLVFHHHHQGKVVHKPGLRGVSSTSNGNFNGRSSPAIGHHWERSLKNVSQGAPI